LSMALPVIDVSTFRGCDKDHPTVAALRTACTEVGFFLVTGHDVPEAVIDAAFAASEKFFTQPLEVKTKYVGTTENCWRGYTSPTVGSGQNCSPESVRPEQKETFYYGEPVPGIAPVSVPGFDDAAQALHTSMLEVTRQLLRGLSLALGLEEGFFEHHAFQRPVAKILMTRYPVVKEGEMSCGAHTDCGFLTLLCADGAGLEVQRRNGTWLSVAPERYQFVANLGDLLQRWTNDVFVSTPHRVLNLGPTDRSSLVFFNNMDEDAEVACLPTCVTECPAKYEPTTCGRYVAEKLQLMRNDFKAVTTGDT